MVFVSYAQNYEDVILWRVFRDMGPGFYIDVGAAHPDIDSVTRAFSDRLWRGINIEPSTEYFERLAAARPRDINLAVLVGEQSGTMTFHQIRNTGLSTIDAAAADEYRRAGHDV